MVTAARTMFAAALVLVMVLPSVAGAAPPPPSPPPAPGPWMPPIWPLPALVTNHSTSLSVTPSASFFKLAGGKTSKTLDAAFARYAKITFPHKTAPPAGADAVAERALLQATSLTTVTLTVASLDETVRCCCCWWWWC